MGEHLKEVDWIDKLPQAGGDWGKGIVGTVRSLEESIGEAEARKSELDDQLAVVQSQVKSSKVELNTEITGKKKLLKATVKRADEEAPMMFANVQIAAARGNGVASPSHDPDDPAQHVE